MTGFPITKELVNENILFRDLRKECPAIEEGEVVKTLDDNFIKIRPNNSEMEDTWFSREEIMILALLDV